MKRWEAGLSACSLLGVAARISVVGALTLAVTPEPGGAASDCTAAFVGDYAVRHMEMGGGIALRRDGSFRYELSYGALDEEAEGRWTCDKTTVFLTSNPVHPPRFAMLAADKAAKGELRIELDVPQGMSRQYFSVLIRKADGSTERREFGEDGIVVAYATQARPLAIVPLLPVYDLAGDAIMLPDGDGLRVRLQFLPNDLGQVAFSRTALQQEGRGLSLQRFGAAILLERSPTAPVRR